MVANAGAGADGSADASADTDAARWQVARLEELTREVRRQTARGPGGPDTRALLDWLARRTGAAVALLADPHGPDVRTDAFPERLGPALGPVLTRLSGGGTSAATTHADGFDAHLTALDGPAPRPVLVAAAPTAVPREAAWLAAHTADALALLRRTHQARQDADGYHPKAAQVRFAVLTALMAGDVGMARRMTAGAVPALLDADRVRVHLLHCPPGDRDRIARALQDPTGYHGPDLLARCPVYDEHLICVLAEHPDGPGEHAGALRRLVETRPHYALGISDPYPLRATAEAYAQACHALAVARNTPQRVAAYQGQAPLVHLLPHREALAWARRYLRPLGTAPQLTRDITGYAVSLSRSGAARILGVSRNTVTSHVRRAEQLLGADLDDVRTCAAVDLALALTGSQTGLEPDPGLDSGPAAPTLDELLHTERAVAWAGAFLVPVQDASHPGLEHLLRTWVEANTDAQRTARVLGVSRNTVRAHLRTAENLLSRDLLTTGSGVHDLVHALRITAETHLLTV
ncbi:helix-turn-helix domain-containing protein [Streptomyces sp. TRM 70351]|uniref:helix-turn-helix domain-containing protein n=1 Tax=Streptomyces sp. TRM 70351 TaxID=3116552 RepID=UPI002E7B428E|nr:helix-turn-helix domain-containing protein [Streptomyces sp. TRM 70351]MEE1930999.1 helix-turn-helix domain-containing protein [Streptomyces sp. TRM 70351]